MLLQILRPSVKTSTNSTAFCNFSLLKKLSTDIISLVTVACSLHSYKSTLLHTSFRNRFKVLQPTNDVDIDLFYGQLILMILKTIKTKYDY